MLRYPWRRTLAWTAPDPKDYKSRPGALAWSFRKSRDGWKRKYRDLKATVKGLKNRIADLTRSREQWRTKAEQAGERLDALEAENAELRARIAEAKDKRMGPGAGPLSFTEGQLEVARGQQYAVGVVQWFAELVLACGASLRCAAATLAAIGAASGRDDLAPDQSTGRLRLLRLGLAALLRPEIDGTLDFVRRPGLYAGAEIDLAAAVPQRSGTAEGLRGELLEFVRGEGLKARPGERLPGTTEVVESCFGKL